MGRTSNSLKGRHQTCPGQSVECLLPVQKEKVEWGGGALVELLHPAYNVDRVPSGQILSKPVLLVTNPVVNPRGEPDLDQPAYSL